MKKKLFSFWIIIGLLALLPVSMILAQSQQTSEHNNLKLAFELGTNVMSGELVKPEQIRENRSSGYHKEDEFYDYGLLGEQSSLRTTYFGVKPEYFIFRNRIGLASGLRFTIASSELASDRDNFLWRTEENGLNTDYIQINDIRQKSYLLGVPLEFRFFVNKRELPFQSYVKMGVSLNYCIYSDNQVNFSNKAMNKYEGLVESQLPKNNAFSAFCYGAFGFKIGKYRDGHFSPWGNIEFQFPYLLLPDNSFAFTREGIGVGVQFSFEIPLGKNVPIATK